MDMPTPCLRCNEIVEFNNMSNIGNELYCEECAFEIEELEGEE